MMEPGCEHTRVPFGADTIPQRFLHSISPPLFSPSCIPYTTPPNAPTLRITPRLPGPLFPITRPLARINLLQVSFLWHTSRRAEVGGEVGRLGVGDGRDEGCAFRGGED